MLSPGLHPSRSDWPGLATDLWYAHMTHVTLSDWITPLLASGGVYRTCRDSVWL